MTIHEAVEVLNAHLFRDSNEWFAADGVLRDRDSVDEFSEFEAIAIAKAYVEQDAVTK